MPRAWYCFFCKETIPNIGLKNQLPAREQGVGEGAQLLVPFLGKTWDLRASVEVFLEIRSLYTVNGPAVGWSDLALFFMFEIVHVSADQVYF